MIPLKTFRNTVAGALLAAVSLTTLSACAGAHCATIAPAASAATARRGSARRSRVMPGSEAPAD